jgi:hypothetical protein
MTPSPSIDGPRPMARRYFASSDVGNSAADP